MESSLLQDTEACTGPTGAGTNPQPALSHTAGCFYDAIPFPVVLTHADGVILQANAAAGRHAAQPAGRLHGQSAHTVFHDRTLSIRDCPVCSRMVDTATDTHDNLEIRLGRTVLEFSLTPLAGVREEAVYVQVVRDVTQNRRLNHLYEMLSATNRAIIHSQTAETLMNAVFEALVTSRTYTLLFMARTDTGDLPMQIIREHGIDPALLPRLALNLGTPDSVFGQAFPRLAEERLICFPVAAADDAWTQYLLRKGITNRTVLSVLCNGKVCGAIGLYADHPEAFDAAEMRLLHEMAEDITFALNGMQAEERHQAIRAQADLSDLRFREVFESSPTPMHIMSTLTGENLAVNPAIRAWLGYTLEEIRTVEACFERVYANPEMARSVWTLWQQDIATISATGTSVRSPELTLRCKDGSLRIARATMTLVGTDAIIAWDDLTEIRRSASALQESEQRFRGMIEQTITGIFVHRDGRYVYVNPRYCSMLGRNAGELTGEDFQTFTPLSPDSSPTLSSLAHGELLTVHCHHRDGRLIELGLKSGPILWDGQPATIVMAEDITERTRMEQQNARYLQQLETSMQGTLLALSNMVELRDPYTAGHERRVSLIAGAIGRHLGWDEPRCRELEMIGLIHDIGKIAVPSELLTRPRRLNDIEMDLIREHAHTGFEILRDIPFNAPVAEVVYQHHERMDGSGYPRGLKGDDILPAARVIAVADVLESMASHRPYRPALGVDAALAELEGGRGVIYDAGVVDALLEMVRHQGYCLPD
ncbi:MAG: PAS domain S-box protein [Fluviicoccus sp.]|uniref:HD domain-containing phosphohydrolase n=1 Tax=Fluviicoccus sp. TaxID=2003552 RepID=UPI002715DAF9|nr:HD domain-containing phosphohydrolase [Fluviicoccus sp.]MDO8330610.1 PAS domain S-box protein [Fluviicoccus sp.]